jgi:hypothetical protein
MPNVLCCFLQFRTFDNHATIRGAALVTDESTEPVEFRCTSPVRPTQLQRTLWGERLMGHIAAKILGKPLVDALTNKPGIVIVRQPEFVEMRPLISFPVLQALKDTELEKVSLLAATNAVDDVLRSDRLEIEPIVMKVHRRFSDDLKFGRELLSEMFRFRSVMEPFLRIEHALDVIHQQDSAK